MTEAQRISKIYARQHKIYERRICPLFLNALKKQVEPLISFIQSGGINPDLDLFIDAKIMRKPITQAYAIVGVLSAKREYYYMNGNDEKSFLGFLLDKWGAIIHEYAVKYSYRIENELAETSKEEIRDVLRLAQENNLTGDDVVKFIRKRVAGISRSRARTIARTEATTASNLGKEVGAKEWLKEQGQEGYKQFIGREDARERHSHFILNDTIVHMDEDFIIGGVAAKRPGDVALPAKERCNCRCTIMYMSKRRYDRFIAGNNNFQ